MELQLRLHRKQGQALLSKALEILYGGAAGGGKSHLMRVAAILWCMQVPGLQVYLFRRTRPDLMKNHMVGPSGFLALLAGLTKSRHVRYNGTENYFEFWNGSRIWLCHCQYEKDVYNYQGAEIHVLMMDELTHFTATIYRFLRGRVRLGGLVVPAALAGMFPKILCGSNPGGVGHNWVKATFIDPAPPLVIHRAASDDGGMLRQYIPARMDDNPTLLENDPEYEARLEGLGNTALVKAMKAGDWDIVAGGMFDDLWDRSTHVIPPFVIPHSWYVDRSFDWGSSHPFSVGWWAESDGTEAPNGRTYARGTLFRFAEWYGWNGKPNEGVKMAAKTIATTIKERERTMVHMDPRCKIQPGPADTSIWDVNNDMCIASDFESEGVAWVRANKSPGSRKTGWQRFRDRLTNSRMYAEKPGLFVFDTCTQFIRTVPVIPRSGTDADDVDTDSEDHVADEARYRVLHNPHAGRPVVGSHVRY